MRRGKGMKRTKDQTAEEIIAKSGVQTYSGRQPREIPKGRLVRKRNGEVRIKRDGSTHTITWRVGQFVIRNGLRGKIQTIEPAKRQLRITWEDGRSSWASYPAVKPLTAIEEEEVTMTKKADSKSTKKESKKLAKLDNKKELKKMAKAAKEDKAKAAKEDKAKKDTEVKANAKKDTEVKAKAVKEKKVKKAKAEKGPSNKGTIYTLWKKSKGKETPEALHKAVKSAVKLTTIKGWTRRWAHGKGMPAIAKK